MQDKPIGVFDSGLGGLTAVKEIAKIMPNENIVYFGDTGRAPYGNKNKDTIIKYTKQDINFLLSRDVKFIVAACGTVSSLLDFVNIKCNVPIKGVIYPACVSAVKITKNGKIGVIGTTTTIKSQSYEKMLLSLNHKLCVYQQDCPEFAPLIEQGYISPSNALLLKYVSKYISKFKNLDIDTLILGCTHYAIIRETIKSVLGNNINLIDAGKEVAKSLFNGLKRNNLLSNRNSKGKKDFFVSGNTEKFLKTANLFLEKNIDENVKIININSY